MKKIFLSLFLLSFGTALRLLAVPAYPYPIKIEQPDGTTLTVRLKGDEFYHYHLTDDGYPIVKDAQGVFNYAVMDEQNNGTWLDTGVKAHDNAIRTRVERAFIAGLQPNPDTRKINRQMRIRRRMNKENTPSASLQFGRFPTTGSPRSLVILVNFADLNFVTPEPRAAFTAMLNEKGYSANGATGSAKDYFEACSGGRFSPQFDVVGPYTLPQPYKYYGENSSGIRVQAEDGDMRAVEMIADACKAAYNAGVDFTLYDVNNDNIVDNVFVFYAGHNEAEGAGTNTVWPHRWEINSYNYPGTPASVTFNGKRVLDYACTSELRGFRGANMAGIATFAHEFGHVLGLADMYPTNEKRHHTLGQWSIMDEGTYLNEGRTPPTYNAFERFQLGYLTPTLLQDAQEVNLPNLIDSNTAYLIPSTDDNDFVVSPENTTEYFLLENRQKTGWDTYLPGHGMLIYRIRYNPSTWANNGPNNDPFDMGVDLVEADRTPNAGSLPGDPFPGAEHVSNYTPVSHKGIRMNHKRLRYIVENNGMVSFWFKYISQVELRVLPAGSGAVNVFVPSGADERTPLNVFDARGVMIRSVSTANQDIVTLSGLPAHMVLMFQLGNYRQKIILME